jgi:S1-C subfamily serine protease
MKKELLSLIITPVLFVGCVSMNEEKITPDMPQKLYPASLQLKNKDSSALYIDSPLTIPDISLQTRTFQRAAQVAESAVVSIYVKTQTPVKVRLIPIKFSFTGIPAKLPGVGLGSGFFIHPAGYVLTNEHVIRNADEIHVMTHNGTDYLATLVAADPVFDLALLKVDSPNNLKFAYLLRGDSSELHGGDHVIAVGNPLGFGHTVTAGIISHTGRSLFEEKDPEGRYVRYLQTDAAINPGSSGGPLITLSGAWIGVNTAQIAHSQGIGFAVPSIQVKEFLANVLEGEGVPVE